MYLSIRYNKAREFYTCNYQVDQGEGTVLERVHPHLCQLNGSPNNKVKPEL